MGLFIGIMGPVIVLGLIAVIFSMVKDLNNRLEVQSNINLELDKKVHDLGKVIANLVKREESIIAEIDTVLLVDYPGYKLTSVYMSDTRLKAHYESLTHGASSPLSDLLLRSKELKRVAEVVCPTKCSTKKPKDK